MKIGRLIKRFFWLVVSSVVILWSLLGLFGTFSVILGASMNQWNLYYGVKHYIGEFENFFTDNSTNFLANWCAFLFNGIVTLCSQSLSAHLVILATGIFFFFKGFIWKTLKKVVEK